MSTDIDAAAALLEERADREYPQSFVPTSPGDQLVGEFVGYDEASMKDGTPAEIIVLQTKEGARSLWLLGTVLQGKFSKTSTDEQALKPKPGDVVFVRFEGKKLGLESGNSYNAWTCLVHRADGSATTDDLASRSSRPLDGDAGEEDTPPNAGLRGGSGRPVGRLPSAQQEPAAERARAAAPAAA